MMKDDLEIASMMLRGAWTPTRRRRATKDLLAPAVFREIDGGELARQYATHRTIEANSALGSPSSEQRFGFPGDSRGRGGLLDWARGLRSRLVAD